MQNKIIQILRSAEGYISGEDISRQLKITRAAIWKNIQELRKEGYDIVAVPHLGYKLESSPDKLFPREIQFNLDTEILGKDIIYHDTIESTMDAAFRLGMEGAKEGVVVCAETQTKGRGRLGRTWNSPKGKGIYASVLLKPQLTPTQVAKFNLLSAVAVREAVKKVSNVDTQIKWPNDLLVNEKKLAGLLTEMSAEMDRVRFIVVGFGINVNSTLNSLPEHATSLKNEANRNISRIGLFQEILRSLEKWYSILNAEGFDPIIEAWKEFSMTLGRRVRFVEEKGVLEGEAIDLDEFGGLIVRNDAGLTVQRMTGDVVHI